MKRKLSALIILLSCFVSDALAQTDFPASVGGESDNIVVMANDRILSSFAANQSYCCTLLPDDAAANVGLSATLKDSSNMDVTGVLRGDVAPAVAVDSMTDSSAANNRVCVSPTTTGTYAMIVSAANGGGASVTARCEKSSLSGGFNTNGTPFNFLECQNLTESTRTIHIFAIDFAGNTLLNGNSMVNQFTIGAGLRRDFDIHTAVGASKFGEVRVVHDGPVGALACRLSRYETNLEFKGSTELK